MNIVAIDRTSKDHGGYNATINLTYDDITILCGSLYRYLKTGTEGQMARENVGKVYDQMQMLREVTCYGKLRPDIIPWPKEGGGDEE